MNVFRCVAVSAGGLAVVIAGAIAPAIAQQHGYSADQIAEGRKLYGANCGRCHNTDGAGVPGVEVTNWLAAYAPKGTPKDIVDKINSAFRAAMADPAVCKRIADMGMEIPPPEQQTPAAFAAL